MSKHDKRQIPAKDREQLVLELLTRLVVAQEKQSAFYEKYDKLLAPMMDTLSSEYVDYIEKKKKSKT